MFCWDLDKRDGGGGQDWQCHRWLPSYYHQLIGGAPVTGAGTTKKQKQQSPLSSFVHSQTGMFSNLIYNYVCILCGRPQKPSWLVRAKIMKNNLFSRQNPCYDNWRARASAGDHLYRETKSWGARCNLGQLITPGPVSQPSLSRVTDGLTVVSGPSDFCQEVCHVKTGWEPQQTISSPALSKY